MSMPMWPGMNAGPGMIAGPQGGFKDPAWETQRFVDTQNTNFVPVYNGKGQNIYLRWADFRDILVGHLKEIRLADKSDKSGDKHVSTEILTIFENLHLEGLEKQLMPQQWGLAFAEYRKAHPWPSSIFEWNRHPLLQAYWFHRGVNEAVLLQIEEQGSLRRSPYNLGNPLPALTAARGEYKKMLHGIRPTPDGHGQILLQIKKIDKDEREEIKKLRMYGPGKGRTLQSAITAVENNARNNRNRLNDKLFRGRKAVAARAAAAAAAATPAAGAAAGLPDLSDEMMDAGKAESGPCPSPFHSLHIYPYFGEKAHNPFILI